MSCCWRIGPSKSNKHVSISNQHTQNWNLDWGFPLCLRTQGAKLDDLTPRRCFPYMVPIYRPSEREWWVFAHRVVQGGFDGFRCGCIGASSASAPSTPHVEDTTRCAVDGGVPWLIVVLAWGTLLKWSIAQGQGDNPVTCTLPQPQTTKASVYLNMNESK